MPLRILAARLRQGHRTNRFPDEVPPLPDRLRGRPAVQSGRCPSGCASCVAACPVEAVSLRESPAIDLGRCLFCGDCAQACPEHAISMSGDYRLAARSRDDLTVAADRTPRIARPLDDERRRLFARSLKLRVVSAGGCNACEADVNVLSTIAWDLGRFGISVVASPRHADGVLVCGPVTRNMQLALRKTWEAVPGPKVAIAVGSCAIAGGPFVSSPEQTGGAAASLPVDLFIPGCPPHPLTILDGLLRLVGRIDDARSR